MGDSALLLSVVVVARNEEEHIAKCLEAVLAATEGLGGRQVVVVDSASTDDTVGIARRYPVRVVRIGGLRPCAAMGRHVGACLTSGRYVMFVDGDTVVARGWPDQAVRFLQANARVAGVAGREDQVYYRGCEAIGFKEDYFRNGNVEATVPQLGGNGVYRRQALEQVGSFNPFARSFEEADVGARLRQTGWHLVRIPAFMGVHHTVPPFAPSEYWRRIRSHLLTGQGQVLRLSLRQGLFFEHLRELNRVVAFIGWMTVGAAFFLAGAATRSAVPIATWLAASAGLLAVFALRSGSATRPFVMVFDWAVCAIPLAWGFLLPPRDQRHFVLQDAVLEDTGPPTEDVSEATLDERFTVFEDGRQQLMSGWVRRVPGSPHRAH